MVNSILNDLKNTFRNGSMISRIILVNVIVFIVVNLIDVFDANSGFAAMLIKKLSLLSNPLDLVFQFWSLITHMFLHVGFWHILWNMLLLFWFGRIIGDFLGDRRILPLYILGGLCGGLFFILWDNLLPGGTGQSWAYGASAAVWAVIMATTILAPDYIFNLLFLGPVKIKYISLTMLLLDLFSTNSSSNTGGFVGHIGGAFFGVLFVYLLRQGNDITTPLQSLFQKIENIGSQQPIRKTDRSNFKVIRNKDTEKPKPNFSQQDELDRILEKIKAKGYEQLSDKEKDFLYQASKKK